MSPAPTITIGQLRHRVMIQQATDVQATDGSITQTWANYVAGYAEIVPFSGSEDFVAQGLSASVVYRITMRFQRGVVPKMRVLWGTREFDIASVRNIDENGRWMILNCEEAV